MEATRTKFDGVVLVEAQAIVVVRQLLAELGGRSALEQLAARGREAHLERELGLGSLERVELMLRLGNACGVRLPDRTVAEADTLQDLIAAILHESSGSPTQDAADFCEPFPAAAAPSPPLRTDLEQQIQNAESLTEIIRLRGLGEPDRAHIQLYEEGGQIRTICFGELLARASAIAADLQRRGLEPRQTVALMLPTGADFFFSFAGILLAGGIPVPIYPPFRVDRISEYAARQASILENAEARFLITFRQAEGLARLLRPRVPSLRAVLNAERIGDSTAIAAPAPTAWRPVEAVPHHGRAEDIALLQYTSGSTGDPKGVVLTHANLLANIRAMIEGLNISSTDVAVSWLPLYHDMGLIGAWFTPIVSGMAAVILSPIAFLSRPERWLRAIHRNRGTLSPAPNFAFELCVRKIADKDIEGLDLSSWRGALNGAEPVRAETLERFAARFEKYGFRREALTPVYGLAEATLGVATPAVGCGYKVDRIRRARFEAEGRALPAAPEDSTALEFVFAGRPLPGVEVRIADTEGRELGERVEGRLWFRGPSATQGYYRNPNATRELLRSGGWVDSGDLAYWADGDLYITGRAKDVIIKAGRNVYPHEVEEIAGGIQGVRPGCVVAFGAPDRQSGTERLVVAAEIRDSRNSSRIAAEISRAVDEALGLPPDLVELFPPHSIPKTSSGKLRRSETRRLYLEGRLGRKLAPAWVQAARLAASGTVPHLRTLAKQGATRTLEVLYGVYALGAFAAILLPLWFIVLVTPERMRAARIARRGVRVMLFCAGVPVRVAGREVLGELKHGGPWIFAPNHSSYVDILVTLAFLPAGARIVAKGEVRSMPFIRTFIRQCGHFAFERSDPQARIEQARQVNAALARGESVVIYPEGTFTPSVGIRPFHLGAFKAAVDQQRPICPVAVRGARQILRDKTYVPRPGRVTLTFGPMIAPDPAAGDDWHEIVRLRDATREIIARHVGEPLL